MKPTSSTSSLKDNQRQLWALLAIALMLPVGLFIASAIQYGSADFIDRRYGTLLPGDSVYLLLLLGLPVLVQVIGLGFLLRGQHDKAVNEFYRLCLMTASLASSGYCLLWLLYTLGFDAQLWSLGALGLIVILMMIVGFVTYLIIQSPLPSIWYSPTLTEDDIRANKVSMCAKLSLARSNNTGHALMKVGRILEKSPSVDIEGAVQSCAYDELNLAAIVKRFNEEIIEGRSFFDDADLEKIDGAKEAKSLWRELHGGHSRLSGEEKRKKSQLANRLLLEACFDDSIILPLPRPPARSRKEMWKQELRIGLARAPFEALVYFLTVFLSVSYLFGFAFAFDDKAHVKSEGQPSLFMARDHASNAIEELRSPSDISQPAAEDVGIIGIPPWPEYVFHLELDSPSLGPENSAFDSESFDNLLATRRELLESQKSLQNKAKEYGHKTLRSGNGFPGKLSNEDVQEARKNRIEIHKELQDNETALKKVDDSLTQNIQAWKRSRSREHLARLAKAIENEATHGRGVVLELRNPATERASESLVPRTTRLSKPSAPGTALVEEEIKRKLKHLLFRKLAENDRAIPANIQWLDIPLSKTTELPGPEIQADRGESSSERIEAALTSLKARNSILAREMSRINVLKDEVKLDSLNERLLAARLFRIGQLALIDEDRPAQAITKDKLNDHIRALREERQFIEFNHGRNNPTSDIRVSIMPIRDNYRYIPLSLMDYMYFTIYTITTTGYGDIVPTTTYAKFLCSLANILEVFFLVVFFNALLSAKRRRER
jgi:hypothetical protein